MERKPLVDTNSENAKLCQMKSVSESDNSDEKTLLNCIPLKDITKICWARENELPRSVNGISSIGVFERNDEDDVEMNKADAGDEDLPPIEYVKNRIYPILLPILTEMLEEAARRECFERPHFAFNGLDFITLNLYARNPRRCGTTQINQLGDIPWVAEHWKTNPRAPLPLSWQWTSAEAATVLQSHWRGYMVRRMEEVQEMRQWQRDWRAINRSSGGAAN
ncbi:hypothetical protein SprV_0802556600 [Sparganum proliferum]